MEPIQPPENSNSNLDSRHDPTSLAPNTSTKYRVRTGCLVCRARKVKCDENRPRCQKCVRLNRTCVYKSPISWALPRSSSTDLDSAALRLQQESGDPSKLPLDPRSWGEDRHYASVEHVDLPRMGSGSSGIEQSHFSIDDDTVHLTPQTHHDTIESPFSNRNDVSSGPTHSVAATSPADRYHATSQIIYLTTIMDWKAAPEVPVVAPFSYFTEIVDCPLLSPFDMLNWSRVKRYIADSGLEHQLVAEALLAVEAVYRAQMDHMAMTHAISNYRSVMDSFVSSLTDHTVAFDMILAVGFLVCICAVTLPNEEEPHLTAFGGDFVAKLETWLSNKHHSAVSARICAWLQLLNITTKRPGSPGLFSQPVLDLLYEHVSEVPNISGLDHDIQPEHYLYDTIATPIFNFHLSVQRVSNRVADVTHYRRSRTTPSDQEEVTEILTALKGDLACLWDNRPGPLRLEPAAIREHFSVDIANRIIDLSGICLAAFHAEIISIGRILGDPPFPSSEARTALAQIRHIVEGDWNSGTNGALNPGYMRPLFVYGLESFGKDESDWAVSQLRRIKHPISRNNFLATFLEAHGEAQRAHSRRVTMKYFCYRTFRMPLPFM